MALPNNSATLYYRSEYSRQYRILVGRIGAQPKFGLMEESGFQYQAMGRLPEESFVNTRPISQARFNLGMN